jgi:hypothetical protein
MICPRPCRSFKPTAFAERLRCVGNSSGNEIGSRPVNYWETIADELSKAGWSWGYVSVVDPQGRTIWIADAHRDGSVSSCVRMKSSPRFGTWKGRYTSLR